MMVGKSVHYKTNPPPPKYFLPFLVSKKKNLQTIQLYTNKQEAGRKKSWWDQVKDDQTANST